MCVYIYVFLYPSFSICKNNDLVSPTVLWRLNTLCIPSPRCLGQSTEQSVTERCVPPNKPEVWGLSIQWVLLVSSGVSLQSERDTAVTPPEVLTGRAENHFRPRVHCWVGESLIVKETQRGMSWSDLYYSLTSGDGVDWGTGTSGMSRLAELVPANFHS